MLALIELGLSLFFGWQKSKASSEVELKEIESREEIARTNAQSRVLIAGSWVFQLFFVIPLSCWFFSVILYSMFFCQDCIIPYAGLDYRWTIAALPAPLDEWSGWIVAFLFLVKVRP